MKDIRECGPTGKLRFTAEEADVKIEKSKSDMSKWMCRVCKGFHLVIRRKRNDSK